jgi:hypothetical protein
MTDAQQRNAVSEGMALGLLMCGIDRVGLRDKVTWDPRIELAWRKWAHSGRFPRVSTDFQQRMDGLAVATRGRKGNQVYNLYWENDGGSWVIRRRPPWDDDPPDFDLMASDVPGGVPADGWKALAEDFSSGISKDL